MTIPGPDGADEGNPAASEASLPEESASARTMSGTGRVPALGLVVGSGATALPQVLAGAWLIADADTGEILAAYNAHKQMRPASTQKMLGVLAALQHLRETDTYVATDDDARENGTRIGMVPGQTYTVSNLLDAIFMKSGNDAARGLATANGGVEKTMEEMREIATRIGAHDTVVRNVTGLEETLPQYSSAHDLVTIAREGLRLKPFREHAAKWETTFPGKTGEPAMKLFSFNNLMRHSYQGAIGVKDGYTRAAGRTFVGAAERGGHTLISAMLMVRGSTYVNTAALLDWGFANVGKMSPVGKLPAPVLDPAPLEAVASSSPVASAVSLEMKPVAASAGTSSFGGMLLTGLTVLIGLVALARLRVLIRLHRSDRRVTLDLRDGQTRTAPDVAVSGPDFGWESTTSGAVRR